MKPPQRVIALLILFLTALPAALWGTDETPSEETDPVLEIAKDLTEEDRQVVEMLDLLEILELLNEYDNVAALEEQP